jgi:hypothetical protein
MTPRRKVTSYLLAAIFFAVRPASAHSWYEAACCSGIDCAPVENGVVVERDDGVHVEGFGILHEGDSRLRWSLDDEDHICASRSQPAKLLCVYRKHKSM